MVDYEEIYSYWLSMILQPLPSVQDMKMSIATMAAATMAFRGVKPRNIEVSAGAPTGTLARLAKDDTGAGYDTIQKLHAYLLSEFGKLQSETGLQISINH